MKLTVDIQRQKDGYLKACVIQEGRAGPSLITRIKLVNTARTHVYKKLQGHTITWTGESPDSDLVRVADKKISTPRDEYGL